MSEIIIAIEAEESVLGAMLWSLEIAREVSQVLEPGDFYREKHRVIYRTLVDLILADQSTDIRSLIVGLSRCGRLEQAGDKNYICQLLDTCPNPKAWKHYCECILEAKARRDIVDVGPRLERIARGEDVREALDKTGETIQEIGKRLDRRGPVHISEGITEVIERMELAKEQGSAITGLATGFARLDSITCGLQPGNLIVVGGRTAMGKTSLCLNIAQNVASGGMPVLFFSLEMSREEIAERLICREAEVDSRCFRSGRLDEDELERVGKAKDAVSSIPLVVEDQGGITLEQTRIAIRQQKPQLVVIDYLQLIYTGRPESRAQEISRVTRELKLLAMSEKVPIIAVSQLRRPGIHLARQEPQLEDLKESGGIEQNADVVLLIYRPEVDNPSDPDLEGVANINLAKHRNGPTGKIRLNWRGRYAAFEDGNRD